MQNKYPRITRHEYIPSEKKKCCECGENKAWLKTTIEINCFRGDDDVLNFCEQCLDKYIQEKCVIEKYKKRPARR